MTVRRQILTKLPQVLGVPIVPGDVLKLRDGRTFHVKALRAIATVDAPRPRWVILDHDGRAIGVREVAKIMLGNGAK